MEVFFNRLRQFLICVANVSGLQVDMITLLSQLVLSSITSPLTLL